MGLFSLFKTKEKVASHQRFSRAARIDSKVEAEAPVDSDRLDAAPASDPLLDAIEGVGLKVDVGSKDVQKTVLNTASEQNSVIQGIYRLIELRTTDRDGLNKRRREAWKVISESMVDVRMELSELSSIIKQVGLSPEVLQKLESAIAGTRQEGQESRQRIEQALLQFRDAQFVKLESMVTELRDAERGRVDTIVAALREQAEERVAAVRQAADLRVFDAIRVGDERVTHQREIRRDKTDEIDAVYRKEFAQLEESYKEIASQKERLRRDRLLEMVTTVDTLEARLKSAEEALARREKVLGDSEPVDEALENQDDEPKKKNFLKKIFAGRNEKQDELLMRLRLLELSLVETQRANKEAMWDLLRSGLDALEKEGVRQMYSLGERYNPSRHVKVDEVDGSPAGSILRERRKGYTIDSDVLRKAEVVVIRL